MKKNKDIVMRSVCGAKFLIEESDVDFNRLITLNETAAFLWEALPNDEEICIDTLVEKLTAEYDVDAEEARANINDLLQKMLEVGALTK